MVASPLSESLLPAVDEIVYPRRDVEADLKVRCDNAMAKSCPFSAMPTLMRNSSVRPVNHPQDEPRCPISSFRVPDSFKGHPGGQYLLEMARQSKVAGLLFLSYHFGTDLDGKVESSARLLGTQIPQRGPMFDEIHEAVIKVKAAHPNQHTYYIVWCLFLTAILPLMFLWWLAYPSYISSVALALLFQLYFLNVFHTRHHKGGRLYQSAMLHKFTTPLCDFMEETWGYSPDSWRVDHQVNHHVYTMTEIDNTLPALYPLLRSCDDQPKLWFHKFQTAYWPLLAPFTAVSFPLNNIVYHGGRIPPFLCWLFAMALPAYLHGWAGVGYTALVQGLAGMSIAYVFSVSHTHSDIDSNQSAVDTYSDIDTWLKSQVEESMSWGGYVATFLLGGINLQIEHHVMPAVDPPLYYFVQPELERICVKYGIRYTSEATLLHAMWQYHMKLWTLG